MNSDLALALLALLALILGGGCVALFVFLTKQRSQLQDVRADLVNAQQLVQHSEQQKEKFGVQLEAVREHEGRLVQELAQTRSQLREREQISAFAEKLQISGDVLLQAKTTEDQHTILDERLRELGLRQKKAKEFEHRLMEVEKALLSQRNQLAMIRDLGKREEALQLRASQLGDQERHCVDREQALAEQLKDLEQRKRQHDQKALDLKQDEQTLATLRADLERRKQDVVKNEQRCAKEEHDLVERQAKLTTFQKELRVRAEQAAATAKIREEEERALAKREADVRHLEEALKRRQRKAQEEVMRLDLQALLRRGGEQLCDQCWKTWRTDEVRYVPDPERGRVVLDALADDNERTNVAKGLLRSEVVVLLKREVVRRAIERVEGTQKSDGLDHQVGRYFRMRCPDALKPQVPHSPMGLMLDVANQWPLPIIGGPGAGKTVYTTVLLATLEKNQHIIDWSAKPFDHESAEVYRRLYEGLYINGVMAQTQPGEGRDLVYQLSHGTSQAQLILYLKDVGGEFWQQYATGEQMTNEGALLPGYLQNAPVLLCLLDPTADPDLYPRAGREEQQAQQRRMLAQRMVFQGLITRLQAGRIPNTQINKHILLVITKSDLMHGKVFEPDHPIYQPAISNDMGFFERTSEELRQRLKAFDYLASLIYMLDSNFSSVTLFAVSALGTSPFINPQTGASTIERYNIVPRRVIDPVLWVMARAREGKR